MKFFKVIPAVLILISFASCGGSNSSDTPGPDPSLGELTQVEELIYTDAYSGKLVVYFDDALGVRIEDSSVIASEAKQSPTDTRTLTVRSATGKEDRIAAIQQVVEARPDLSIKTAVARPEEEVDRQRAKLERLSGKELVDWNSVYKIEEADPDEAVRIMRELAETEGVAKVYPQLNPSPAGLSSTPSLVGHQTYLYDELTYGGLNAQAAWNAGITGQDVYVVDNEPGMNFDHEEFNLVKANFPAGNWFYQADCAPGIPPAIPNCESWIAHGTAVTGILIAGNNGNGTTGFAYSADYVQGSMTGGVGDDLSAFAIEGGGLEPGSVWLLEVQLPGKFNITGSCAGETMQDQYGCVPVELWPDVFDAIEAASAYGVTVIEGGGNGQMDLDNPDLYTGAWSFAKNLSYEDSGALMTGASEGANEIKAAFSNCGSRFNTFAWGQGVVTTAYPYGQYGWTGSTPPIPPNDSDNTYFMDNFGGTSSAAAMVGGAAVLVQSHARNQMGHRRYIMPHKLREILVNSGVTQADSGCNIGMQPRIDQAMSLVNAFWVQVQGAYPKIALNQQLTDQEYIDSRAMGIGIICKEYDAAGSDPCCPDSEMFPKGTKIAKDYDFDGDDRADLVQYTNGTWKIDLSGTGSAGDNFGAWDVSVNFSPIAGDWVWPYVADMNSDGRADLVVYDKGAGKFYVSFTDTQLTRNSVWHGWDWVIDYSGQWHDQLTLNPNDADYSRPAIADYNNDGWVDIGISCSDGNVRVDYSDGTQNSLGNYEWSAQLLTTQMLNQAPGWAYLTVPYIFAGGDNKVYFGVKVPDTHPDEGRMYIIPQDGTAFHPEYDWMYAAAHIFGGNDAVPLIGEFYLGGENVGLKEPDQRWRVTDDWYFDTLIELPPANIYGGPECHPVAGNFDGDGFDDRAVMCPDEWRIAYSGTEFSSQMDSNGVRHIPLTYEPEDFALPGKSYAGGISYEYALQIIAEFQKQHPGVPPPIPVDMVTVISCSPGDC
ncbi:MAG: S8 family serine peptidase [Pseudomonadota bacterium]